MTTYDPMTIALRAIVEQLLRGHDNLQQLYERAQHGAQAIHDAEDDRESFTEQQHAVFNDAKSLVYEIVNEAAHQAGDPPLRP